MNFDMSKSKEIIGEANQLEAVKYDGYTIKYIHNPSEQVQLAAVKHDGYAIQYIHNPSEQVMLAAVKQNGNALQYFHNPQLSDGEKIKGLDHQSENNT